MRNVLAIGALAVATVGAVAVLLPSEPGPRAPVSSIDLGVQSPAGIPTVAQPTVTTPEPSAPATVPQAPPPAPEPAPVPTGLDRDERVEPGDDRDDEPDEPDDDLDDGGDDEPDDD